MYIQKFSNEQYNDHISENKIMVSKLNQISGQQVPECFVEILF